MRKPLLSIPVPGDIPYRTRAALRYLLEVAGVRVRSGRLCKLCKERHRFSEPHIYHLRVPEMDIPGETEDTVVTVGEIHGEYGEWREGCLEVKRLRMA